MRMSMSSVRSNKYMKMSLGTDRPSMVKRMSISSNRPIMFKRLSKKRMMSLRDKDDSPNTSFELKE